MYFFFKFSLLMTFTHQENKCCSQNMYQMLFINHYYYTMLLFFPQKKNSVGLCKGLSKLGSFFLMQYMYYEK